jgi:hypothetical protein
VTVVQFQVRKRDVADTRVVESPDAALAPGQLRTRIAHFAYTANNITYAAFGEAMHYWRFFPAAATPGASADQTADETADWGCIPVWGFAEVVQSLHPAVAVGERLYGYWPMASQAVLTPRRPRPEGFADGAPHRAELHAVYNQYLRTGADPFYTPDSEGAQALLRPLFLTAWLIDDFLADNDFFGTAAGGERALMLLSSASSKTAVATAACLSARPDVEVVGLTSARHVAFCEGLGVYARVLAYEALDTLDATRPAVYVDFAGNGELRRAVHTRFDRLAHSCSIGGTHVEQLGGARDLPGPRPVLFFAPAQVRKRSADWGGAELNRRLAEAWHAYRARATDPAAPWLVVQRHVGPEAVRAAHLQVLRGQGDPRLGHLLSLAASA